MACLRWLGGLLLALAASAQAQAPWRICLPNAPFPPFLNNDPDRPGTVERLLVAAGQRAGLQVQFERLPVARCQAQIVSSEFDGVLLSAASSEAPGLQFPRRAADGELDSSRMLARAALLWFQTPGGPLRWDGQRVSGLPSGSLVGMRIGMRAGVSRLTEMGFVVDQSAKDATQLLRMVQAGRVAAAVLMDVEHNGVAAEFQGRVEALSRPLYVEQYFLAAPAALDPQRQARLEAIWRQIGLLRDTPAFRR